VRKDSLRFVQIAGCAFDFVQIARCAFEVEGRVVRKGLVSYEASFRQGETLHFESGVGHKVAQYVCC